MSITNLGNQYITWDYKHPATARDFNTVLREGIKPGIYKGGEITLLGGVEISIAPFVAYLKSGADKLVRVETRTSIQLSITESTPVLSITYTWSDVIENWLDFNQRASGSSPIADEITFGEFIFDSGSIVSIDQTEKTWGLYHNDGNLRIPEGKVGINNNFPSKELDIIGDVKIDGNLEITSTDLVDNLNADQVDGYDAGNLSGQIPVSNGTVNINLNADMVDGCDVETTLSPTLNTKIPTSKAIANWVLNNVYPVGSFYVQYPDAASNDDAIAFPVSKRPATLFGGTWVEQFNTEAIFFRTAGESETRVNGLQNDAMQRIYGQFTTRYGAISSADGVFSQHYVGGTRADANSGAYDTQIQFNSAGSTSPNPAKTSEYETRPKNRRMKLWKRTA
jgi:hypothetical protein